MVPNKKKLKKDHVTFPLPLQGYKVWFDTGLEPRSNASQAVTRSENVNLYQTPDN